MLSRQYKLSRWTFPGHGEIKSSFVGDVLRIQSYRMPSNTVPVGKIDKTALTPRFAVVVSKKLSTNAVKRNSFKRVIMEVIERNMKFFQKFPYQKHVIFPKVPLRLIDSENIKKDIKAFLA